MLYFIVYSEGTTDKLREHLMDELDYVLVPELAWTKLVTWYSNVPDQVRRNSILDMSLSPIYFFCHLKLGIALAIPAPN